MELYLLLLPSLRGASRFGIYGMLIHPLMETLQDLTGIYFGGAVPLAICGLDFTTYGGLDPI